MKEERGNKMNYSNKIVKNILGSKKSKRRMMDDEDPYGRQEERDEWRKVEDAERRAIEEEYER